MINKSYSKKRADLDLPGFKRIAHFKDFRKNGVLHSKYTMGLCGQYSYPGEEPPKVRWQLAAQGEGNS